MLQIGKNGITETVIEEIKKRLKKDKTIDVKFLRTAFFEKDKNDCFKELVEKTDTKLVRKIGFTLTLGK
jgi:RNA-binding protein